MSGVVGDDLAELVANMMTHHLRHVGQIADLSRAFTKRTTGAEESCTTGAMSEGRMARGVGTVW